MCSNYNQKALLKFFQLFTCDKNCMSQYSEESMLKDENSKDTIITAVTFLSTLPFSLYIDAERNYKHDVIEEENE
jgi:hypothetical protein